MTPTQRIPYRPDPPPDLELSPLFDIEGKEGAADWVRDNVKSGPQRPGGSTTTRLPAT